MRRNKVKIKGKIETDRIDIWRSRKKAEEVGRGRSEVVRNDCMELDFPTEVPGASLEVCDNATYEAGSKRTRRPASETISGRVRR